MSELHRKEYLRRIHRAQDYIERNLLQPLEIECIAREACFSPYHFHRIFSAITGETLYQFILRLRLERAAGNLCQFMDRPITDIALECGFSSSATFARAFAARFGLSASDFRKNCKTNRKEGKVTDRTLHYLGNPESAFPRSDPMKKFVPLRPKSLTVEKMESRNVAYVRHVGPYAGDNDLFERMWAQVVQWAEPRGLTAKYEKICIYHDDPEITEQAKLRLSVGLTVPPATPVPAPLNTLELPMGDYVRAIFELDVTEYGQAWGYVMGEWLPQSGYQCDDGPAYECCLNDPQSHPEGKHIVEIRVGVKPLGLA